MTAGWIFSFLLIWSHPSILAVFNPFLAPISSCIQQRRLISSLWSSYVTGLLRDIILSSPRLGLLGFSSLLTTAIVYRLSRLFSLEGWQGSFVVAMLAIGEFFVSSFLCYFCGHVDDSSFLSVWSWKSFFLFVVFSCLWTLFIGTATIFISWSINRIFRRQPS